MMLYRHKDNGLLYTLARVSPRGYTGSWLEARAYRHSVTIPRPRLEDFDAVALDSHTEDPR